MVKNAKIKYILFGIISTIITLFAIIGVGYTLHLLPNTTNADTEHTYYANMISKTFSDKDVSMHDMEHNADNWINHVNNLGNYHVETSFSYSDDNPPSDREHVVLVKKHESPYQKKALKCQKNILKLMKSING